MRATATLLLTAVLLALAVIALAPSALIGTRISEATSGRLRLMDTEGVLWNGRGTLALANARTPVTWSVQGSDLLRGRLTLQLNAEGAAARVPAGTLSASGDGIAASGIEALVPAQALWSAFATAKGIALGGDLMLSVKQLEQRRGSLTGQVELTWQRASAVLMPGRKTLDLGEVRLALAADGTQLTGPIENVGGSVALRGNLTLTSGQGSAGSVLITPRGGADADLAGFLAAVGKPESGGWRVDWRTGTR